MIIVNSWDTPNNLLTNGTFWGDVRDILNDLASLSPTVIEVKHKCEMDLPDECFLGLSTRSNGMKRK